MTAHEETTRSLGDGATEVLDTGENMAVPQAIERQNSAGETDIFLPPGAQITVAPGDFEPLLTAKELRAEGLEMDDAVLGGILMVPDDSFALMVVDRGANKERNRYMLMTAAGFRTAVIQADFGKPYSHQKGICEVPDLGSVTIGGRQRYAHKFGLASVPAITSDKHVSVRADLNGVLTIIDTDSSNGTRFVTGPRR